jgi:hypothetical protein
VDTAREVAHCDLVVHHAGAETAYACSSGEAMTEPLEQALRQGNVFGEARRP